MKQEWVDLSLKLSSEKADFYSGCRKILRPKRLVFENFDSQSLQLKDAGYTSSKMSMLKRNYLHEESRAAALALWAQRVAKAKYGSVGFTTYNHFMKGDIKGATPRGSVMGPCIQSVVLTWCRKGGVEVDVFYRTTELFKKFPADLVFLRDVLLAPFQVKPQDLTCHFANVTCHPMYWVTLIPHLKDPIGELEIIKKKDKYFYDWIVKWTARYLCPKFFHGIEKFAQAMRVRQDALARIDPATIKKLQRYLTDNHPGYRGKTTEEDDE